jgi:prolyl-tRNA editing enzyme YbaK/EbsC (Cys-tRNA(Pro) deacylase)
MDADPAVDDRHEIVLAAGRQDVSVRMSTSDLFGADPVIITPLTAESRTETPAS